ncbi:MAG: glycosyl hydrolase family 18 protein [Clostridia bacterium]|nr:glycosyl hydrolase family 18 protein [Clostridia bacterium]
MRAKKRTKKINYRKLIGDIIASFIFIWVMMQIFLPSFDILSIYERMPELVSGNSGLLINGEIVREGSPIIYENGEVMLPVFILTKYVDDTIIQNDNYVICANKTTYIRYEKDEIKFVLNGKVKKGNACPIEKDGMMYLPMSLLKELYGITFNYISDYNILLMDLANVKRDICLVNADDVMRETSTIKSSIVGNVILGSEVTRYSDDGTWSRIVNSNGESGFIKSNLLSYKESITNEASSDIELNSGLTYGNEKVLLSNDEMLDDKENVKNKIDIVWYQVNSKSSNPKTNTLKKVPGMTHMCFTWFEINDKDGNIREKIDNDIVKWAHKNNYKIWALVTNPFSDSSLSHDMLSNAVSRENSIKQMMSYCKKYGIDGINVDIESIKSKTGPYYVQYIRELSVFCNLNDLELSLDMYMPSQGTSFYNRKVVSEYVDYFCLMAYDEHWSTCPEAGSVGSLPWVERGIKETLKEVDNNKLVLGIPLYTRRWEVDKKNKVINQKSFGMDNAMNDLKENKAKIIFDEETKQNFGEYTKDNSIFKIWLEDQTSIKQRLDLATKYNLIGVASWKKGFDNDDIWKLYEEYMKK